MRVVTVAQMKQIEKLADANGVSYYQMMENAGTAAYHILRQRVPHAKHIAVVAGKEIMAETALSWRVSRHKMVCQSRLFSRRESR